MSTHNSAKTKSDTTEARIESTSRIREYEIESRAAGRGLGTRVGHIDTGVDPSHSALAGRVEAFLRTGRYGERLISCPPTDDEGHGTHTAAIVCQVAPRARLCCAAVIHGGHAIVRILEGLDWVLGQGVRVVSMPLGLPDPNPILEPMLVEARRLGALVIAPVGNGGAGRSRAPGESECVLSVGAAESTGRVAPFSGSCNLPGRLTCRKPDVVASGVNISSAARGGGTISRSGTSMASAFVAGLAALLFEAMPDATVDEVESAICASAVPLPEDQSHRAARGLVQPALAMEWLRNRHKPDVAKERRSVISCGPFVDPRLQAELERKGAGASVVAVVAARSGPVEALVARAHGDAVAPDTVRYLRGGIAIVRTERRIVERLVTDCDLAIASAADVNRWPLPWDSDG